MTNARTTPARRRGARTPQSRPDTLSEATDDAAILLAEEIDLCRQAVGAYLRTVWDPDPDMAPPERVRAINLALSLMTASGELAGAIARLKGEMRQHISVERSERGLVQPADNASAPDSGTRRERLARYPRPGGGGRPES